MLKNIETFWLTELDLEQFKEVKHLLSDCNKNDQGGPLIYQKSLLSMRLPAVNGLIYFQHKLIAFVSVYFFYRTACECSLLVSPKYRNRGLAKSLLRTLIPILKSQNMESIYFSASPSLPLKNHPLLSLSSIEYQLTLTLDKTIKDLSHRLKFRVATLKDIKTLCEIDKACFVNYDIPTMINRYKDIIINPHYHILIGELEGAIIAKAHIHWQQQNATLSDIAVLPAWQRKGYGREIIHACLLEAQQRYFKQIDLDVEAKNKGAIQLYLSQGFQIKKVTNFWEMKI